MDKITFNHEELITTVSIDSLKEILEKEMNVEYFISRNVSILENNKEMSRTVLSTYRNIIELDFMEQSFNILCTIKLSNETKYSLMKEDVDLNSVVILRTIAQNEDLVMIDSIKYYNKKLPETIKVSQNKELSVLLDEEIIQDNKKLEDIEVLINYKPNKIINLCDEKYLVKVYDDNNVRFKFSESTKDLNLLDEGFYENKKIRIKDENIFNFSGYIFCKTNNNNCIVLSQKNKAS